MKPTVLCLGVVLAMSGITLPQHSANGRTGTVRGTAVFVSSKVNKYLRDAPKVTLVFTDSRNRRTKLETDEIGDFSAELRAGRYCVSAMTATGQSLPLSPKQLKCFHVTANKDTRLDVMVEARNDCRKIAIS